MAAPALPLADLGSSFTSFFDAVGEFFSNLAAVSWLSLLLGLAAFVVYLTLRARAYFHMLRAAYPDERIQFRNIWGAYIAAYGFNNVVPARGGDVIRLFLTKTSVPNSSYPAVASAFFVEAVFDLTIGVFDPRVRVHAGRVPEAAGLLGAARVRPRVLRVAPAVHAVRADRARDRACSSRFAVLSARVRAFWARVRQGIDDPARPPRATSARCGSSSSPAGCSASPRSGSCSRRSTSAARCSNVLLVLGVNAVAALVPFTPGGAGVQQALLVKVFAGTAAGATVAAYSVGQQIAIARVHVRVGFVALVVVLFGFRSFKEVIAAGARPRSGEAERTPRGSRS